MRKHWSTKKTDWQDLPKEILRGRWKSTKLGKIYKSRIPHLSGVYMMVVSIPNVSASKLKDIKSPLYVGLSKNLNRRFNDHLDKQEFLDARDTFQGNVEFYFLEIPIEDMRSYEQKLINCFGPVVNRINSVAIGNPLKGHYIKEKKL